MLKIKYLFHSGFLVETQDKILVFDYFEDNCKKQSAFSCGKLKPEDFSDDKEVIFFVSHAHYDHFDKEIFKLHKNSKYVISNDLRIAKNDNITICAPYQKFTIGDLQIETFGSTDEGISFLINIEGKKIFHAGDLNWWYWKDDTPDEEKYMKEYYQKIIEQIRKNNNIDIAFFPVDPRLEEFCYLGGEYFAENVKPKIMIPMHFDEKFYICKEFKEKIERFDIEGALIERTNYLLKFKTDI